MSLLMAMLAQAAVVPGSMPTLVLTTRPPRDCSVPSGDEVVVCGGRPDRYRLPLPRERDRTDVDPSAGAPASGLTAITPAGRCGLFAGERRCGKKEAAAYGYGDGRDPLTVLVRVGGKVLAPDREP